VLLVTSIWSTSAPFLSVQCRDVTALKGGCVMVCAWSRSFWRTIKGWLWQSLRWWPTHHCSVPPLPLATLVRLISELCQNTSSTPIPPTKPAFLSLSLPTSTMCCYDFDRFRLYSRDRSQSVSDNVLSSEFGRRCRVWSRARRWLQLVGCAALLLDASNFGGLDRVGESGIEPRRSLRKTRASLRRSRLLSWYSN